MTIIKSAHGAALIEYGLLIGLISVVSIGSVVSLGSRVDTTFSTATTELITNMGPSAEATAPESVPYDTISMVQMQADTYSQSGIEYIGWQSVSPQWGTRLSGDNTVYEIVGLFSTSASRSIVKLPGDHLMTDMTGVELVCAQGRYPLSGADRFHVSSNTRTEFRFNDPVERPVFVTGEEYTCTIERPAS